MVKKSKNEIKTILKYYFDPQNLPRYLKYYKDSVDDFDTELFQNIVKLQAKYSSVDVDVLYVLTFAQRNILTERDGRNHVEEHRISKSQMKDDLKMLRLLQRINEKESETQNISIVYGKTFKFEDPDLFSDMKLFLMDNITDRINLKKPLPEDLTRLIEELEEIYEPVLRKKKEASPYNLSVCEFAFSVFKYLIGDKVYNPSVVQEGFAQEEGLKKPNMEHSFFLGKLYHLTDAYYENKVKKKMESTTVFKMKGGEIERQFHDLIWSHISYCRKWLTKEVYFMDDDPDKPRLYYKM